MPSKIDGNRKDNPNLDKVPTTVMVRKKKEEKESKNQKRAEISKTTKGLPSTRIGLIQSEEDNELVSKLLREVYDAYRQPRVRDDYELAERLNQYFSVCAEESRIPTIEEMALYIGYTVGGMYQMMTGRASGFSENTCMLLQKAKNLVQAFDAKLVMSGKLNFLAYCFRAKNYYDMVDKKEHVITPNSDSEQYSIEEIKARYIEVDDD